MITDLEKYLNKAMEDLISGTAEKIDTKARQVRAALEDAYNKGKRDAIEKGGEAQTINVGDIVFQKLDYSDGYKGVVTRVIKGVGCTVLWDDGDTGSYYHGDCDSLNYEDIAGMKTGERSETLLKLLFELRTRTLTLKNDFYIKEPKYDETTTES